MRRVAVALALLGSLAACREGFFDPTPGPAGPRKPPSVEFIAENVRMRPGGAEAVRIGFESADGAVRVIVQRSEEGGRIAACPVERVADPVPDATVCLPDLPNGVRESFSRAGLGGLILIREGGPVTVGVRLEFEEGSRRIELRLPVIERPAGASACKDNACNPFFELRPVRGGRFTATARWSGAEGRLEMLEGRVLARALTSTGLPYRIVGEDQGASPLEVSANLSAPSEYALAFRNPDAGPGSADLTAIVIEATWP